MKWWESGFRIAADVRFEESKHPRSEGGKFSTSGLTRATPEQMKMADSAAGNQHDHDGYKPATSYPVASVPVDKIRATQDVVNQNVVDKLTSGEEVNVKKPFLFEKDGLYYVQDGHHRIEAMIQKGAVNIDAHVQRYTL